MTASLLPLAGESANNSPIRFPIPLRSRECGPRLTPAAVREFIAMMRRDPTAEFQTRAVAERFGVPAFVFIRAFKKISGLSPQRFRAALRIELAKRLLVDTDRPITEISLDVGYNSLGTFVRTFTALVGSSPGQLRRLARGGDPDAILRGAPYAERPHSGSRPLHAMVEHSLPSSGMMVAGLFPQALPAGLPFDGCFVDPAEPRFDLAWPGGRRRASLLVAAFGAFSLTDAWAGSLHEIHVGSCVTVAPTACSAPICVRLRALVATDPPFLTPIPLLMLLQARRK